MMRAKLYISICIIFFCFGIENTITAQVWKTHEPAPLGQAAGASKMIRQNSGVTGGNIFQNNLWLFREGTGGTDWYSTRLQDGVAVDVSFLVPGSTTQTWWERDPASDIQSWGSGSKTYFMINAGNVGVGGSPEFESKFHVFGDMSIGSDTQTALITGPGNGGAIQIKSNRAFGGNEDRFLRLGWIDNLRNFYPKLTINNAGNVGIGTTNPQSLLSVKGKISAQEVQVTLTGWSDFVFFDSYKLRPLSEVETFIQENKHLPDVPSAAMVEKEGVNLGEMDAILLRKIEELTLYVIELKKEIADLKKENQPINSK